jgi:hypothetical protein
MEPISGETQHNLQIPIPSQITIWLYRLGLRIKTKMAY